MPLEEHKFGMQQMRFW